MPIRQAVPLLRVSDVARSIDWYRATLGFAADPFPSVPPYKFAILRNGQSEIMLRCGTQPLVRATPPPYDWDIYLCLENTPFRDLFSLLNTRGIVTRRLERMFYGLAEFEITDPDGYVLCLSQELEDASDLPTPVI
jgi:catechol 2,3-dioxygenase-like lactoylglutathione lyase family enzyme